MGGEKNLAVMSRRQAREYLKAIIVRPVIDSDDISKGGEKDETIHGSQNCPL